MKEEFVSEREQEIMDCIKSGDFKVIHFFKGGFGLNFFANSENDILRERYKILGDSSLDYEITTNMVRKGWIEESEFISTPQGPVVKYKVKHENDLGN